MNSSMSRFVFIVLALGMALATSRASGDVLVAYDFEDGTTQGWSPRGPVTLDVVTDTAHTGMYSLRTTGRTAGWNSPSLNVLSLLEVGATYTISGCTRLVAGEAPTRTIIAQSRYWAQQKRRDCSLKAAG